MLIRSQDNKILINFDNAESICITKIDNDVVVWGGGHLIAEYSTEEKAVKVLDMIEQAYGTMRVSSVITKEVMEDAIKVCVEHGMESGKASDIIIDNLVKTNIFQMPADDEVEDD